MDESNADSRMRIGFLFGRMSGIALFGPQGSSVSEGSAER
jgi:hypothetical protein